MHIEIIDDSVADVRLVKGKLNENKLFKQKGSTYGYEFGLDGLKFYSKADADLLPDVIVLEAKYADGSAMDLIRFSKTSEKLKGIPIVIYTGSEDVETKRACLAAGAIKVIQKGPKGPVELSNFLAT